MTKRELNDELLQIREWAKARRKQRLPFLPSEGAFYSGIGKVVDWDAALVDMEDEKEKP